jgi:hypothetical protein
MFVAARAGGVIHRNVDRSYSRKYRKMHYGVGLMAAAMLDAPRERAQKYLHVEI